MTELEQIKLEDIVENIQESIINSGGKFFKRLEIKRMTVESLLELLIPNKIELKTFKKIDLDK